MDTRDIMIMLFGVAQLFMGLFIRSQIERIRYLEQANADQDKQINTLAVNLAGNYSAKQDLEKLADSIFQALRRIEEKLDRKVDKS